MVIGLCCFAAGAFTRVLAGSDSFPAFEIFYPTVFAATLLGGAIAGATCAVPALLWDWLYAIPPIGSFRVDDYHGMSSITLFTASCALLLYFSTDQGRALLGALEQGDLLLPARGEDSRGASSNVFRSTACTYSLRYIGPDRDRVENLMAEVAQFEQARREAQKIAQELRNGGPPPRLGFVEVIDSNGSVVFSVSTA